MFIYLDLLFPLVIRNGECERGGAKEEEGRAVERESHNTEACRAHLREGGGGGVERVGWRGSE